MIKTVQRRRARRVARAMPIDIATRVFDSIYQAQDRTAWDRALGVELSEVLAEAAPRPGGASVWRARGELVGRDGHIRYAVAKVTKLEDLDVELIDVLNRIGELVLALDNEGAAT